MQISEIYYFRCWLVLVGSQTSQKTLHSSVSLTGKELLDSEPRLGNVHTKEQLLAQCLWNSGQYGKITLMFLFCHSKTGSDCLHFFYTLYLLSQFFGNKNSTNIHLDIKQKFSKSEFFAKNSNKLRGSSNYAVSEYHLHHTAIQTREHNMSITFHIAEHYLRVYRV